MSVNDKNPFENLPVSTDPVGTVNTLIKVLRKQQSNEPKAKFSGTYENAFTLKVDEKERISKAVDQLSTSLQSYPKPIRINMPPVLMALQGKRKSIEIKDLDLLLDRRTLRKITGKVPDKQDNSHRLTDDQVKELFNEISDPVMILESDTAGGVVIVTQLEDSDNKPYISSIHLNKKQDSYFFNNIASTYSKDNFKNWIDVQGKKGNILYFNNKKKP